MKRTILSFALLFAATTAAQAQESKYDINGDGDVNVGDVTALINHILGKDKPEPGGTDEAVEAGLCPDTHHPHAIDMGAAGKWACCNVGASNPFENGGYYAWGEIEEKSEYSSSNYNVSINTDFSGNKLYDVAAAKWGGSWKMPTINRFEFLYYNCSNEWTTLNEVNGRVFTASNGNSIFLPAAGYRYYSELGTAGSFGYYWSSTPSPSDGGHAYGLNFRSTGANWYSNTRIYGRSVRPVSE